MAAKSNTHETQDAYAVQYVLFHIALVQSIACFVQIALQVLGGNVVVHAHHSALQDRPHALDGVGVDFRPGRIPWCPVSHRLVVVGQILQRVRGTGTATIFPSLSRIPRTGCMLTEPRPRSSFLDACFLAS